MADAGMDVLRVEGGYKALRAELLPRFADPGELRVLAGYTGSGKTALLRALPSEWSIDLEAMARHRGSSFGDLFDEPQPRQATFENTLGLKLYHERHPHLIEDESLRIGSVSLPIELKRRMVLAPMILVEASVEARADRIFTEYVALPRRNGIARERVHGHLRGSIEALERRLGGARATEIRAHLDRVFGDPALDTEPLAHREWIAPLLTHYYDKFYRHTIEDRERKIAFRGTWEECREWIGEKFG
jgi:tRNA 2-selenouridine synthase